MRHFVFFPSMPPSHWSHRSLILFAMGMVNSFALSRNSVVHGGFVGVAPGKAALTAIIINRAHRFRPFMMAPATLFTRFWCIAVVIVWCSSVVLVHAFINGVSGSAFVPLAAVTVAFCLYPM
eukprot:GHVN01027120.1.p1 GENE.GHVN01027120.1~~GHVN01027120.1.p1  ORF type:complete len:122 (+),score=0.71 GHVN01027120.1:416-781(+)